MYMIPLTTEPNQTFASTIPVENVNRKLSFNLRYNAIAEYWSLTVIDGVSNEILIDSIPLLRGQFPAADLFEQFEYMKLGSATIVHQGQLPEGYNPDDKTLGTEFFLLWGDRVG